MKLWSQFFIPTLKESPADAEIASHKLLIRAGLVRKLSGGLYTYLPLGLRVIQKITQMCRGTRCIGRDRVVDAPCASGGVVAGGPAMGRRARDHVSRRQRRRWQTALARSRVCAWPDARGSDHAAREGGNHKLSRSAQKLLPDRDKVPE